MAISLSDIHNAVRDYFSSLVVPSITVTPLPEGTSQINPGEHFSITLTAKNSVDDPAQGVQISNVCYHVQVDHPKKAQLIVPSRLVAAARSGPSPSSDLLDPGKPEDEMFLFPITAIIADPNVPIDDSRGSILGAGRPTSLTIQGTALEAGTPELTFELLAAVDFVSLFEDQSSATISQSVSIKEITT